jgi:hypothetical protein
MTRDVDSPPKTSRGKGHMIKPKDLLVPEWMLVEAMGRKRIRTVKELTSRLSAAGLKLSEPHVSRIVRRMPGYLSIELLKALLFILDCDVADLIRFHRIPNEADKMPAPGSPTSAIAEAKKNASDSPEEPGKRRKRRRTFDPAESIFSGMPADDDDEDRGTK